MSIRRRTILKGAAGASALASGALSTPVVLGQVKSPHAGTTINASCFQTTYFEYLKTYFPAQESPHFRRDRRGQ